MEKESNSKDIIKFITGGISAEKHSDEEMNNIADNILQKAGYEKKRPSFREFFTFGGKSGASSLKPVFAIILLLIVSFAVYMFVLDDDTNKTTREETAAMKTNEQTSVTERQRSVPPPKEETSTKPEIKAEIKTETVQLDVDSRALSSDGGASPEAKTDIIKKAEFTLAGIFSNNQLVFTKSGNRIKTKWYEIIPGKEQKDQIIFSAEFDTEKNIVVFKENRRPATTGENHPVKPQNFYENLINDFKVKYFNN